MLGEKLHAPIDQVPVIDGLCRRVAAMRENLEGDARPHTAFSGGFGDRVYPPSSSIETVPPLGLINGARTT